MRVKTILAIIILLAAALGGGLALYFYLTPPDGPGVTRPFFGNLPIIGGRGPASGGTPAPTAQPTAVPQKDHPLLQIIDKEVLAPTLSDDGKALFYILPENGRVFSSDFNGDNEKSVTTLNILESYDAIWAPKKNVVAMFYHEGGGVKKFLNGVASGTPSRFLAPEAVSFDWAPDGRSIAYLSRRALDTALVIADAANKNPRVVYNTPVPDFTVRWVAKNIILLVSRPSGLAPSLVLRFDVGLKSANPIFSGTNGITLAAATDSATLLLSRTSGAGSLQPLATYDLKSGRTTPLNAMTLAEKCVFSSDAKKLYCGVPRDSIPAPMPDEWYKGIVSFADKVVAVDLATNQETTLMENEAAIDVISPFLSPDGKYLFFQDKKTGTVWRITLVKDGINE